MRTCSAPLPGRCLFVRNLPVRPRVVLFVKMMQDTGCMMQDKNGSDSAHLVPGTWYLAPFPHLKSYKAVVLYLLFLAGWLCWMVVGGMPAESTGSLLIVLNKSDHTAMLIRPDTKEVLAILPTGRGPHEVAVSPDGRWAYVADYGTRDAPGHTLTVLDLIGRKVHRTIDLSPFRRPHGLAVLPDGRVAVTCEENQALVVVEPKAGRVDFSVSTDQRVSHMVVVTPDGSRAFVANIGDGSVTVIDLKKRARLVTVPVDAGTEGIDRSPDGRFVYVANRVADTIAAIDAESFRVLRKAPTCKFPIRIRALPDGRSLLVSCAQANQVALHDATTLELLRTLDVGSVPIGSVVEPSGRRAYVAFSGDDRVGVIDLSTWQVVDTISTGDEPDGMALTGRP